MTTLATSSSPSSAIGKDAYPSESRTPPGITIQAEVKVVLDFQKLAGEPSRMTADRIGRPHLRTVGESAPLLAPDEGSAVELVNQEGRADILLICEHASNRIPASLSELGLDQIVLSSHAAWDPGAEGVSRHLAEALDAPLILQRFSRLVYDCNRPPDAASAMPVRSEIYDIPGNTGLSEAARQRRIEAIYRPFRDAIARHLDNKIAEGDAPAVITIHSFTPIFHGQRRAVELGLLHDDDAALADAMLRASAEGTDLDVRRNEPYGPKDGVTHTLQVDAVERGLMNVMIEIRNDLIGTAAEQADMAMTLAGLITEGLSGAKPRAESPDGGTAG
jgi:predicted N-formylglutamate amidohydrolase